MFKLIVIGKNGKEESEFKTREEAQAHFDKYRNIGHWGRESFTIDHPAVIIEHPEIPEVIAVDGQDEVLNEKGEIVEPKIEAIEGSPRVQAWTEVVSDAWIETVPAQFSYEIQDKTAEVLAEKVKRDAKKSERISRVDQLKAIDWSTIDTIAELRTIVRVLVREAIKDDE